MEPTSFAQLSQYFSSVEQHKTAVYYAELSDSPELLALTLYAAHHYEKAYAVFENIINNKPPLSTILVYCNLCLKLNKLTSLHTLITNTLHSAVTTDLEKANLYNYLGIVARKTCRQEAAIEYFLCAFKLNPFLWEAFDNLCQLGHRFIHSTDDFILGNAAANMSTVFNEISKKNEIITASIVNPMTTTKKPNPSPYADQLRTVRKPTAIKSTAKPAAIKSSVNKNITRTLRSHPLSSSTSKSTVKKSTTSKPVILPPQKPTIQPTTLKNNQETWPILTTILKSHSNLHCFNLPLSLSLYSALPFPYNEFPIILTSLAKIHYEMGEYEQSAELFAKVRARDTWRTEGMDVYSVVLWHLKREEELSYLGMEMSSGCRNSCESWIAVGNCFSLQKDHVTAIECFKRAVLLDPYYSYAHTLMGHEYASTESHDVALTTYRTSIRLSPTSYHSWHGMAALYLAQDNYKLALFYFERAVAIKPDPKSICLMGTIAAKMRDYERALELFDWAVEKGKGRKNNSIHYKKALVLFLVGRYEEALEELEPLKYETQMDMAISGEGEESNVYMLAGKIYKKLGMTDKAVLMFTLAQDYFMGARQYQMLKDSIDKIYSGDADGKDGLGMEFLND